MAKRWTQREVDEAIEWLRCRYYLRVLAEHLSLDDYQRYCSNHLDAHPDMVIAVYADESLPLGAEAPLEVAQRLEEGWRP